MKICIYGGSFNPITKAHIGIAEQITKHFDEVWLLPSFCSVTGKNLVDPVSRLAMCNLSVKNHDEIKVCDFEIKYQLKGETVDNLMKLFEEYKSENHQFYFLMGLDTFNSLPTWPTFEKFINNINFCVVNRSNIVKTFNYDKCMFLDIEPYDISSTEWRNCYKENGSNNGFVDDSVFEYIKANNLFM